MHSMSQAFADKGCAANITALLILLFLKRGETKIGEENEHPIKLKQRKNKCIGQIVHNNCLLQYVFFKGKKVRDEKTMRKK